MASQKQNRIFCHIVLDGHSSHATLSLVEFCAANTIELIALYPNATHILQPLDVSFFHPLKNAWKMAVDRWRLDNNFGKLRKEDLPALLQTAVDTLHPKSILPNGFKTCGLYPFSPEAVNYNV